MKKTNKNICECAIIHQDVVRAVEAAMPSEERQLELSDFFRVFGDSTRIRILQALGIHEMCVCDLCCVLAMNQSAVSHQLRVLKQARLVRYRKEGKVVYYRLDDEHIGQIIDVGMRHVLERN